MPAVEVGAAIPHLELRLVLAEVEGRVMETPLAVGQGMQRLQIVVAAAVEVLKVAELEAQVVLV